LLPESFGALSVPDPSFNTYFGVQQTASFFFSYASLTTTLTLGTPGFALSMKGKTDALGEFLKILKNQRMIRRSSLINIKYNNLPPEKKEKLVFPKLSRV
jgi:hypothetical protein